MAAVLKNISLQGYYSYRGLFLWLNWPAYVSNVFIEPVVLVVLLTLTGRFAGAASAEHYILGAALFGTLNILSGGIHQSFFYDRVFGTLSLIYASRANRWLTYWSKGILHYPNGILVASTSLFFGWLLLGLDVSQVNWPALALLLALISFSCLFFVLFVGNLCIAFRDWFVIRALTVGIFLTLTGVIIPTDQLPGLLGQVGHVLPLTHGLAAFRETFAGAGIGSVGSDILHELVVGVSYLVAGGGFFKLLEANAKRTGTYESAI